MRVLVIGAGALGGYYGACLVRAGGDVTFLVREKRAEQLRRNGLQVVSPHGDFAVQPKLLAASDLKHPFDVVLVGVKAYSLDDAMSQFAPAVGPNTMILPILNGLKHIDALSARFGAARILGGLANVSAGLDADGRVVQFMFGLAQLYQLRGRVGRSKLRAYALFTLPAQQKITAQAERRLTVLQSLETLGAGFQLASHDLDIRGAGNLLGEEQSGHIKEVGFELYQSMLEEAIVNLKAGVAEPAADRWSPQITIGMNIRTR